MEAISVDRVFWDAAQMTSPAEREAYLDRVCVHDVELRRKVERLLRAHAKAEHYLETPAVAVAETHVERSATERVGTEIGPYRLLEQIGEGGMGVVWHAEQLHPVQRRVAVKVIKPGMDSRQVLARFEAERQVLALMDHPHISKVFDAGTTDAGRPYFVMELVQGQSITKYCDEHRLTPRERLELFLPVCQAVQHAHQKGIIHRDLKPSNILVAHPPDPPLTKGPGGVPKVIDFGVAKATGQRLTENTLFTAFGAVVGTLEYMSPEQADAKNQDIDTRSDIYALGVLLYELLTGTTPLTRARLKQTSYDEIRRLIREEEPPRPSTRLSESKDSLAAIAAQRQTEPAKLTKLVRGELDWIVMKALEKDRNRRYETANALAQDVQRYLADEAVLACPPSAGYRLRKFVRRNKAIVLAATVFLMLLGGGIIGTTIGLVQADRAWRLEAEQRKAAELEREEKEKARQEAVAHLQIARRAIDQMLTRVAIDRAGFEPRMERMWRDLLQDALAFYQELHKARSDDPVVRLEMAMAYSRLGRAHERLRESASAMDTLRQAIAILEKLAAETALTAEGRETLIASYRHLGWVYSEVGRRDERVAAHRQALQHAEKLVADFSAVPEHLNVLGNCCTILGYGLKPIQPQDAEALFQRAIRLLDTPTGNRHHLGTAHLALGELLMETGRLAEAEKSLDRALALFEKVVADFPRMWQSKDRLSDVCLQRAKVLAAGGRLDEATDSVRLAIDMWEQQKAAFPGVPRYRDDLVVGYAELVRLLALAGHADEAKSQFRKISSVTPESAAACNDLAWLTVTCAEKSLRDPARAVQLAQKARKLTPQFARHWRTLGAAQLRNNDAKAAVVVLKESMEMRAGDTAGGDGYDWFLLAMAHESLGEKEPARQWYDRAAAWLEKHQPRNEELRRLRAETAEQLNIDRKKD